ncbi:hypothetical protein SCB49_14510 [unidentified eubacterium SCB49]|nr:hypothetical protein SCB49_14510 [unidentified eubacterium SCB49]
MKKAFLYLFMGATFIQCTADQEGETTVENQNLTYEKGLDLSTQLPNANFDTANSGLYVGTAVSNDLTFHERLYINIYNDNHINAQFLINKFTTASYIYLQGSVLNADENTYEFSGEIGSFKLQIENNEATIYDAIFDNKQAVANVFKSTSKDPLTPTIGTFSANSTDHDADGTWDAIYTETNDDRFDGSVISIVLNSTSYTITNSEELSYRRFCNPIEGSENLLSRLICRAQSENDIAQLAGLPINFHFRIVESNEDLPTCDYPTAAEMVEVQNTWSWNGREGTITLDRSTLPSFD